MDVKAYLKEARDAIKNKDYKAALNISKKVLKEDKANYMALVFLGISLQEIGPIDKAEAAFRKAISINNSNILAWNGLQNYYEKSDCVNTQTELINVYSKIIELESNETKIIEIIKKIAALKTEENFLLLLKPIYQITKHENVSNDVKTQAFKIVVMNVNFNDVTNDLLQIYKQCFESLFTIRTEITKDLYEKYLKVLNLLKEYELISIEAEKMHKIFELDSVSLEWMCKIFNDLYIEGETITDIIKLNAENYVDKLLARRSDSSIGTLTKAILVYEKGDVLEAMEIINEISNLKAGVHASLFYIRCCLELYFYEKAAQAALKIKKTLKADNKLKELLEKYLCQSLCKSTEKDYLEQNIEYCLNIFNNLEADNFILCCLIESYINLENFVESQLFLNKLDENSDEFIILKAKLLMKMNEFDNALKHLQGKPIERSEYFVLLAQVHWKLKNTKKCLVPLIRATKLDSNSYINFLNLGKYYQEVGDTDKAKRCYEKCFKLNQDCAEAGIELCNIYRSLNKWNENLELLLNLTRGKSPLAIKWAFIQLGIHYLEKKDYINAIDKLRLIIRVDPTNQHCWESLADAYLGRGAYISALKSYQQALELKPNCLYPMLQIANIKKILGEFVEARKEFENILVLNKLYVPALKGIAETCYYQSLQYYNRELYGLARDWLQYAIDKIVLAIRERNNLSCLWKLAADCCYITTKLPEKYSCLLIASALAEGSDSAGNSILMENELFDLAEKCYIKASQLIDDNIFLYHDLANCYLSHAKCLNEDEKADLLEKAFIITQYCINNNPMHWKYWNLLGNIAFQQEPKNLALAQHSFIKAVSYERKSAIAWCNLGTLYFHIGDIKLANDAFSQAQRGDPSYVISWIGQALIAEHAQHEDAMDLFRHSTQLSAHPQGALGYAYWVCKTLMDNPPHAKLYSIENMHAIPVACDALNWYTERHPYDPCAWNMLGFLRERMGLKQSTLEAYNNARRYASKEYIDAVLVNYARMLRKMGKHSESVEAYREIKEATFNSGSGLALSLFKDKQYQESFETYEGALHCLTEEQTHQSDLLVALASMTYMFQGPEPAKTLLFQSVELKQRSPWSLYATLALGLLHQDLNLSQLVVKELDVLKDDPNCISNYADLVTYFYLLQGDNRKALKELSKLLHRHPSQGSLWLSISILLIRLHDEKPETAAAAANCAKNAMKLGQFNMDVTKVLCIVSLSLILSGRCEEALKAAQTAIHYYPELTDAWCVLIYAIKSINNKSKQNIDSYLTFIKTCLKCDEHLIDWLNIF